MRQEEGKKGLLAKGARFDTRIPSINAETVAKFVSSF
jgi:hypothetical protein